MGPSAPHPDLLFPRGKSRQKHARREKPFRWGFSPVTPSSATTQRGHASAQAPHPSSCRKRQASLASLRLLLPRQLRWFASERPLRGRFSLASDLRQYRGESKGGEPPLCRRGGGVHRGGTPSKGSRPYAAFWLLFVRTKSNPGRGGGTPTGQRDGARHHKSRKSLTTPSRSRRTFSSSSTVSRLVWILPI